MQLRGDIVLAPLAYYSLGAAHVGAGDTDIAREAYEQGLKIAPSNPWLQAAIGQLELKLARYSEAESALRHALELWPNEGRWISDLGVAIVRQGRRKEADQLMEGRLSPE